MFAFEQPEASWLPTAGAGQRYADNTNGTTVLERSTNEDAQREFASFEAVAQDATQGTSTGTTMGGQICGAAKGKSSLSEALQQPHTAYTSTGSTPPIDIGAASTTPRGRTTDIADHTLKPVNLSGKAARRKKRAQKKSVLAALHSPSVLTPGTSCDEDSDFSSGEVFKKRDLSVTRSFSITSSLGRGSSPGGSVSALTRQLENLNADNGLQKPSLLRHKSKLGTETPSSVSAASEGHSDEDANQITSYEVPLEHDFTSPDAPKDAENAPGRGPMLDQISRKMTASDFEPLRCLGKGSYGTVLLVKHAATGRLYAQKQFRKASLTVRKQLVEQTKTERAILESINRHPFVVKLYYAFQDHEMLYLILEYAQGGELFTRMLTERMFPEDTASFYMAEMVLALEHLHTTIGVVYRDLKPENCLLDSEGHLLLTDFGLSKVAVDGDYRCRSMTGTVEYMAPEVIQQRAAYDTAVDWWSFGILGFDLLTGSSPFAANNETRTKEKILRSKLVLPYFLSPDAKDLLTRLLRKEPRKRLVDLKLIKQHRFFRKIDWKRLERRECEPPIKPLITDPELAENFAAEFTGLPLSPLLPGGGSGGGAGGGGHDPFGGFSFVASSSVLQSGHGFF
ncbi:MAG: hypothetical protein Q9191_005595 [Dirinaria sp. TL-2023a]